MLRKKQDFESRKRDIITPERHDTTAENLRQLVPKSILPVSNLYSAKLTRKSASKLIMFHTVYLYAHTCEFETQGN